jgi:hypothetical protein
LNNVAWWLADAGVELDLALDLARKAVRAHTEHLGRTSLTDVTLGDAGIVFSLCAAWDTLGWVYFKKGDLGEADVFLRQAWDVAQQSEIGEHLGQVYEARGERGDAIKLYQLSVAAGAASSSFSIQRLRELNGGTVDEARVKAAATDALISLRTLSLPQLATERASAEFLLLVDGTGSILDARFLKGDRVLETSAAQLVGVRSSFRALEGAPLRLVRRASISCVPGAKCTGVLHLPGDVRSIE